jgi:hypothetical protein
MQDNDLKPLSDYIRLAIDEMRIKDPNPLILENTLVALGIPREKAKEDMMKGRCITPEIYSYLMRGKNQYDMYSMLMGLSQ